MELSVKSELSRECSTEGGVLFLEIDVLQDNHLLLKASVSICFRSISL